VTQVAKATFGLREWLTPGSGILHVRASMDDEEIELKGEEDQPQRSLNPVYENRLLLSSYASGLLPACTCTCGCVWITTTFSLGQSPVIAGQRGSLLPSSYLA
jgi:hypothetical protein